MTVTDFRSRVVAIMEGIERLSTAPVQPAVMLHGFSQGVVHALGATAAVIWELQEHGITKRFTYPETAHVSTIIQRQSHETILRQHVQTHAPESVPGDSQEILDADADIRVLLLMCSFTCSAIPDGVVEVFQRPETPVAARPGFIAFLTQAVKFLEKSVALSTG